MIAEILFPVALDRTFYYKIPDDLKSSIVPGIRVYASFARRKRALGYVISVFEEREEKFDFELKQIDKVIDKVPPFIVEKFLELSNFISERWFSPKGMVLRDFLRYLPLKLNLVNIEKTGFSVPKKKFIISSNLSDDIINFISVHYGKKPIVIFFPNIFVLKLFLEKIKNNGYYAIGYSSDEKVSVRKKITQMVLNNDFNLILSTKGGIHLPFKWDIEFLVVEPLNHMYRQFDQHPYYETVEVLLKICEMYSNNITFFSSSISPLFLDMVKKGQLEIENKKRDKVPAYKIFDLKNESILSDNFFSKVKSVVELGKKVLVMSYSKYASNITFCPSCKTIKRCQRCDSVMRTDMFDGEKVYICPYCNFKEDYSNFCESCKTVMTSLGYGAQRIYDELINMFPDKKIIYIDGRIVHVPLRLANVISQILKKDFDIIVSTDILASHIIDVKFGLVVFTVYESQNSYDYTYFERFFEKLYNIFGLCLDDSDVFIYTYNPTSQVFSYIANPFGYMEFELSMRKALDYPPFGYVYRVDMIMKDKDKLKENIRYLMNMISEDFKKRYCIIDINFSDKIRRLRKEKSYIHSTVIKMTDYHVFFDFIKDFAARNKIKLDVVSI